MTSSSSTGLNHAAPPPVPNLEPGARVGLSAGSGAAEVELQALLFDERIKCEKLKTNYKTLKTEYTRLEDAYAQSQGELKCLLRDSEAQQERLKLRLAEFQRELQGKSTELEELRQQVMSPLRLELLRVQMQQEMEAPVRERFSVLEEEAEKYRCEYNKLRYDHTILLTQLDHQRDEHARALEGKNILHEAEIARLVGERKDLVAHYERSDPLRDAKRVEALQREKIQLRERLKGLEAEVAELRAQREDLGQQAESVQRVQNRQHMESQAALKSVEAESQSLRQQLERMERELHESSEQNNQLSGRLHRAEREVSSLTGQMESLKYSHKQEVSNARLEFSRCEAALEREKDSLQEQTDGLRVDVETLQAAVERHKGALVEKEREMVRKVQSTREEEARKIAALHEEKLELADRLAALEKKMALWDAADHAQREAWEERLRSVQRGEESARRELLSVRTKLQQQSSQHEETQRRLAEISALQQRNQELVVHVGRLTHSEGDLRDTLELAREELRTARAEAERLEGRGAKLQQKYSALREKLQRAAEAQKKRKTLTERTERKLQGNIELLEAKVEELKLEAAAARRCTSFSEERTRLRRQLKHLQQRLYEFQCVLFGGQGPDGAGPALVTSSHMPVLLLGSEVPSSNVPEDQHQRQLSLLHQRIQDLETSLQLQLEELGSGVQREQEPDL